MKIKNKLQIVEQQMEIEYDLSELINKMDIDFNLLDIKEIIYNEDGQDCLTGIVAMFDVGQEMDEFNNILELINEAWNYFPHKILGGLSPAEMVLEFQNKK